MFDRKQSLPWLIAFSIATAGLGQLLLLGAAPHARPLRAAPHVIARRLAASLKPHPPTHLLSKDRPVGVEL